MKIINKLIFVSIFLFFINNSLFAQIYGKLTGTVTDKTTGEPLPYANVFLVGTSLGSTTDSEAGRFTVLQIPAGTYSIKATYIGYHPLTVHEVKIRPDLTTKLNFELTESIMETEAIEIVAEQKLVHHDITSTRRSIDKDDIESLPSVENVRDIMMSQAGVILESVEPITLGDGIQLETRDPSLAGLNIRGSSGGDALILIDGVPASHPVYGGFDVLDLNVEEIENIEIITGAFGAEYGNTQSGVINITTRSGGRKTRGSVNYRTDRIFSESYDKDRLFMSLDGPIKFNKLGLKIPGNLNYYATYTLDLTNTSNNNHRTRSTLFKFPAESWGFADDDWNLLDERQENDGNLNFKLDYNLQPFKFALSYRDAWKRWSQFEWDWKNYPDHTSDYLRDTKQINFNITHTLSKKSFYKLNFGYTNVDYQNNLNGKSPNDIWVFTPDTIYSSVQSPQRDPQTQFFTDEGYQTPWVDNSNSVFSIKFDFTSQFHADHLLKSGFTFDYKSLSNVTINSAGLSLSNYGKYLYEGGNQVPEPPGPYKEFGLSRWVVQGYPLSGSFYMTDKFEKETIIINIGLRMDWFRPGSPTTKNYWKEQWEYAIKGEIEADWPEIHYQIDPRIGVSFPISEKTTMYFAYGHYNKLPGIDNYLRDPFSGGFTGNPHLDFIKTVKFEFGFTYQFAQNWAVDIKNYNNETAGQVSTTYLPSNYVDPIYLHDNKGYSRARGIELEVRKRTSDNYIGGRFNYSLQWVHGYSSSAFEDYLRSLDNFPPPIREKRLSWDVRHQIVFQGNITVKRGQHPRLFGVKLPDDWNITWLTNFNSGRPYTPGTYDAALREQWRYSETGPFYSNTDLKIEKGFKFVGTDVKVGLDIDNLFNQFNVNVARGFNIWTGKPYTYGDAIDNTSQQYNYYEMYRRLTPRRFGLERHIELILEVSF